MFNNLLAEMARCNPQITKRDISVCLEVSEKTIRNYFNGHSKISWKDTVMIRNEFFPTMSLEYLFDTSENDLKAR